jgi:hypothetical protein
MTHINLVSIFKMISLVKRSIIFQVRDDLDEDVAVSDDDILSLHDNSSNDDESIDDDIQVKSWIVFDYTIFSTSWNVFDYTIFSTSWNNFVYTVGSHHR